jgi:hypothetical protein
MLWLDYAKNKKKLPPKETLETEYLTIGETIASLARKYKVNDVTMKTWLCTYGIARKTKAQNKAEYDIKKEKKKEKEKKQA